MQKGSFTFVTLVLFTANTFAKTTAGLAQDPHQQKAGIAFTENKGQVHDQDQKPRPDVLYGVMAGDMAVHIKNNGLSYQLYRVDQWKETEGSGQLAVGGRQMAESRKEIARQTIYRIDLNWLNHNTHFTRSEDETLPGFNNYYLASCPEGVLKVKSYKGITLKNLYQGIDLHYYEKNGELKHDYIVAPHTDYRQIQLQVEGAEISVNEDGSLLLSTPLGKVQEGAPVVYQNGRPLKAKWQVKNNILSFEIGNYDPNYELIIDPVTRIWGTYYGGGTTDIGRSCSPDASGNVYLAGYSNSTSSGTLIATVGSHQSANGGGSFDAFLAKFTSSGLRLWGTFYGGSGEDRAYSCATDASDNVFVVGVTNSNTGGISTPGSHQSSFGAFSNSTTDAFLVKFNANGVRQWGTYYGGQGDDAAYSCATDASGNIYMAGSAESNFAIATGGAHQSLYGGGVYDPFLVKFNTNGSRQWGTYYGNAANDVGYGCATDASSNVYLTGATYSAGAISTPGSHQPTLGGSTDAFLVKFNTSGVRQWGTYYGGTGNDYGLSCAADASGNVYLAGDAVSNTGTAIATAGSHQSAHGGGTNNPFLVKFNATGARQWGTYYGGNGSDYASSCATDAAGNVYLAGNAGTNTGTIIATPSSQQATYGGGGDAFLAKFDAGGTRQSGTYYGGSGNEGGFSCTTDAAGNVYMAGQTSSGTATVMATAGVHQPAFGGGNFYDAFLVKFDACDVAPAQPSVISSPATVCQGAAASFSTPFAPGVTSYTLLLPGGGSFSGNSNIITATPASSGVFTLIAGNACGVSPDQTLHVTVNSLPTITVNSGTICSGASFTIIASGANTYSYSGGSVVSPITTSSYTVTGTDVMGCSNTAVSSVTVMASPNVSVNSGAICLGQSFTMAASGAVTYTYSSGPVVSPVTTSSYSVTGANSLGCSNTAVSNVTVNPLPNVIIATTHPVLCLGESATLTANGALTYTFNPGISAPSMTVSPGVNTSYTLTGTDSKGCSKTAVLTQSVDACLGIDQQAAAGSRQLTVYPNPSKGMVYLELGSGHEIMIVNAIGQIVYSSKLSAGHHQVNLEHLAKGVYIVKLSDAVNSKDLKLIKE